MLMGMYEISIDAKNRLGIPAKFRDELGLKCILTRGLDECLILYPMSTWEEQQSKLIALPKSDKDVRAYLRYIYSNAIEAEPDKQGRIVLPARYRDMAHISKDIVVIGMPDRIEIWAKEVYDNSLLGGKLSADDLDAFNKSYQV